MADQLQTSRSFRIWQKGLRIGLFVLLVALMGGAAWLVIPKGPPSFPVPHPNGYDDFLRAARVALPSSFDPRSGMGVMRQIVVLNAQAYKWVQAGLEEPCRVPLQCSWAWLQRHESDLGRLKELTYCLIERAVLAEKEGMLKQSLADYLQAYRFTSELGRGGLPIDVLNQISCQVLVMESFESLIPRLDESQRARALAVIQRIEHEQESPALAMRRAYQINQTYGVKVRLAYWVRLCKEAWRTHSLKPFTAARRHLISQQAGYRTYYYQPVCAALGRAPTSNSSASSQGAH